MILLRLLYKLLKLALRMCFYIPMLLFLLAIAIYLPPVQHWLKGYLTDYLSEETGMEVKIDRVRLSFPADLLVENFSAIDKADSTGRRDTVVAAEGLLLDVEIAPSIIDGEISLNGFELRQATINSKSYISDTRIEGHFNVLGIAKPTTCNLPKKKVDVSKVRFKDADFRVILSDTAKKDTAKKEPLEWYITINKFDVENTRFYLQMPGDSMRIKGDVKSLQAREADINLKDSTYSLASLSLDANDVGYDIPYMKPTKGFDANHLAFGNIKTQLTDFIYDKNGINLNLKHLQLNEKSGLTLNKLSGAIHYDSTRVDVNNGYLETPSSKSNFMVNLPFGALDKHSPERIRAKFNGKLGRKDVMLFAGDALGEYAKYYPATPLQINCSLEGNTNNVYINYCTLTLPGNIDVSVSGSARQIMSDKLRNGNLRYSMALKNIDFIKGLIPPSVLQSITIPNNLRIGGDITFSGNNFKLSKNTLYSGNGSLTYDGTFSASTMTYKGRLISRQFPLQAFMPKMGLSPLTADFDLDGHGTDFMNTATLKTKANIASFTYAGISFAGMKLDASINGKKASGTLVSTAKWLRGNIAFTAEMAGDEISGTARGTISDLALNMGMPPKKLAPGEEPSIMDDMHVMMDFDLSGHFNTRTGAMGVGGNIGQCNITSSTMGYPGNDINFGLETKADSTYFFINSGDMTATFKSTDQIDKIASGLASFGSEFTDQLLSAQLNQDTLKRHLPNMELHIEAGISNPLQQLLMANGYALDTLYADIRTSKEAGINANVKVENFKTGSLVLDHNLLTINQQADGIKFNLTSDNLAKTNNNRFLAKVDGAIHSDGFEALATFIDEKGKEGVHIGTRTRLDGQGGASFTLIPKVSTLAYRKFYVNEDNFVTIDKNGLIKANLDLVADDKTRLQLVSNDNDQVEQDLTLSIDNLNLYDLSQVIPFMPSLDGRLGGDLHIVKSGGTVTAVGMMGFNKLAYEGTLVGDFSTEVFYMPDEGKQYLQANILVGKEELDVATLDGYYYTNEGKLDASLTLNSFPCNMLNSFMGSSGMIGLKGNLNGEVKVVGPTDNLDLNGKLEPDSIHVYSELYGVDLKMENKDILINHGKIELNNIGFYAKDDNPLRINGFVDLGDFSNTKIDMKIKAQNFEVINSQKTKASVVYGKVYVDLDATLKGNTDLMIFKGDLNVLGNTNVTYVMSGGPLEVEDQFEGLVEFVDFSEEGKEVEEEKEEKKPSGLFMVLNIGVNDATKIHCDMTEDGKSYVDCHGGTAGRMLKLIMFPSGDMQLTGKFDINGGEMKYTLPFIPLRTFKFIEGNYIQFTGDVGNPTLNITAMETTKAAVTGESGTSRMVEFNTGVKISKNLENMGIEFLIEAPKDQEVQNELASMTADQKSRLAISMMATGLYLSNDNKAGFKANNALNAFLESQIQNIAGSALKTIDISVGVEGNTTTTGETQTDYSFQFSKKLWGDRVTFVIGGKVTTGATETNANQSFIDNISLEYRLDNDNSRYIRLFYDNDNRDPLEGSYSSAGAGYILRRKTDSLGDLIIFKKRKK